MSRTERPTSEWEFPRSLPGTTREEKQVESQWLRPAPKQQARREAGREAGREGGRMPRIKDKEFFAPCAHESAKDKVIYRLV